MNRFSENLSQLRREAGYTQESLAEAMGVSRQAVSKWESGQAMPDQGGNPNAYIDRAVGITHCMDMEDMYIEILQDYCTEGNSYQEKLAACLAKEDWKNFAVYVHAVKSSSKTIGAEIFGEEARVLEMAAKEQDIALIRGNWEQFCVDFEAVIAAAEKLRVELAG